MKLPIRSIVFGLAVIGGHAFGQPAGLDPVGTWLTEDGRAKIRLERCGEGGEKLCGFVAWMKDPLNDKGQPRTDLKNPDPAKRGRPSLGLQLMTGLKSEDPTHFEGEIYNADDGKMYNVTLSVEKVSELEVRGCLLHFLCGSQTWARVADIPPPATLVAAKTLAVTPAKLVKPFTGSSHSHDSAPAK